MAARGKPASPRPVGAAWRPARSRSAFASAVTQRSPADVWRGSTNAPGVRASPCRCLAEVAIVTTFGQVAQRDQHGLQRLGCGLLGGGSQRCVSSMSSDAGIVVPRRLSRVAIQAVLRRLAAAGYRGHRVSLPVWQELRPTKHRSALCTLPAWPRWPARTWPRPRRQASPLVCRWPHGPVSAPERRWLR